MSKSPYGQSAKYSKLFVTEEHVNTVVIWLDQVTILNTSRSVKIPVPDLDLGPIDLANAASSKQALKYF